MKGPKQARQEGPLSILRGSTFGSLLKNIFALRKGPKLGPQHSESGASLGACLTPHSNTLLRRVVRNQATNISVTHHGQLRVGNQGLEQFKIPATDAVCVKVASSLTFCAHSSLQSFSTSDKMKGPKTGPPGGTTFDPKRVHFWVTSEIYLLRARVQNWALSILNLVPPWGLV